MPMTFGPTTVTAKHIRAAMLGTPLAGVRVLRQARRIRDHDTDELGLVCVSESSWWVAQRLGDRLTVWAFAGDDEAWLGFDRQLAEGGWREAIPATRA